jgi:ribonucleotide reductase alpha subunit
MDRKPFYWLNEDSRTFLSRGYLSEGETPESRIRDIADKAEWYLKDMAKKNNKDTSQFDGFADKFYEYMSRGYYSLSSPVWANYGKHRGLAVSCFGGFINDTMESILYGVAENGMLMKNGGGTSGYFGKVRHRGAPIKDQGESSGSVHFMQLYDTLASVVSQGSVRRGFFAAYQDIEHPDAEEFLDIGTEGNPIQGLTTSVIVSDQFINDMKNGDAEKRKLWAKVLQRRSEIGYPYIMFGDNVNRNKPQVYKDKNMKIYASQMCLRGDSIMVVKFGFDAEPVEIDIETFVKLWGIGAVPPDTTVKTEKGFQVVTAAAKTGSTKEMIRITDEETGKFVECTPDHKIYTQNRGWVMAQDLTEEDELLLAMDLVGGSIKIERITYEEEIPVYDITVPETSSFFANDILVHNCSEISLPSSDDETFTCVLSSLNVLHWDEIKHTDAIEVMTMFLDTVNEEFVRKSEGQEYLKRARQFAMNHRALGLGILGWHSYLQSNMIAFESNTAARKNLEIAKTLKEKSHAASRKLAEILGEPPLLVGYGMRNTTTMAIAPTKSSSFILGQVSQSIELEFSNCYVKDLAKIKVTIKNPYLEKLLKEKGKDSTSVWDSIKSADGSVQHLDFLTQEEKDVFKTFSEVDPYIIIDQAAVRQEYIDQSQSLNLMLDPSMSVKEINALYLYAHEMGIKNLYYSYSMSAAQSLTRKKVTSAGCASCEA